MNLLELTLRLKGYPLKSAKRLLPDLTKHTIGRRDSIVDFHRRYNPLYRELTTGIENGCFEKLPIVTKRDFQRPLEQIISDGLRLGKLYVANTSGSSGHPFFYAKDKTSHAITHAIALDLYAQHGITPASLQARVYGIPSSGLSRYKEILKDFLCNRVRFPVFDLSDERLSRYLKRFEKYRFQYVYGYTSAIVQFAKYLHRNNLVMKQVCPSLHCCIVTSEVCTPQDRECIEQAFGIKVINEYGCSETGVIAFEDTCGRWNLVDTDSYYEVVDDDGNVLPWGGVGRILITSLSNQAMPFIRYEIGDRGIIDLIDGRLVLRELSGRVSDLIRLPSGRTAAGLTFYYVSRTVLEKHNMIREFIVRQTAIDTFVFDMVADRELTPSETDFLRNAMDQYLEPGLNLVVNRVTQIVRPASGKIKHFYSEL